MKLNKLLMTSASAALILVAPAFAQEETQATIESERDVPRQRL